MRIFLVRHGQSMGNVDRSIHLTMADHAIPLSEEGKGMATAAGVFLRDKFIPERDRSYVIGSHHNKLRLWLSPYLRTRQTADCLYEPMKGERLIGDRREHILLCEQQFGLFDGIPTEDLPKRYPDESAYYQKNQDFEGRFWARMPLGESRFDVAQRVHQAFGTFHRDADKHGIKDIIVVAHGTTIRAFLMMWLHLTPEWFEAEPNPKNCSIRLLENGEDKGYIFPGF